MAAQIILASASPRRRELLQQVNINAMVQSVDIDETQKTGEPVSEFVKRLALEKAQCGVSALFLAEKIDQGPVIATRNVPLPLDTDLDYDFDPRIRAELLGDVIEDYSQKGHFDTVIQDGGTGETYYIIHPALRHIAKLSLEK